MPRVIIRLKTGENMRHLDGRRAGPYIYIPLKKKKKPLAPLIQILSE